MPLAVDKRAGYMRAYRAARRAVQQADQAAVAVATQPVPPPVRPPAPVAPAPTPPPVVDPTVEPAPAVKPGNRRFVTGETIEHALARHREVVDPRFPSGFHYLPGDDWVARMTQARRDEILGRMARASRG